ncbi:hypothetical protein O3W44_22570 [Pantoea sp. LMR881]|uniref:hypothetical protein n=1 Tax=Pantoea sp. LMR881 TaxID=3014336 RepID=UPI0022AEC8B7|nr:hypothetical protein [Pantoea sp. LMR881]MCZ4061319.1 hypothetical protein [Pantoea sp. LMR881]
MNKKINVLGEIEKAQKTITKPTRKQASKASTKPYKSPHEQALKRLAKKPSLLEGKQEHYEQVRIFWHFEQFSPAIYQRLAATPNGGWRGFKAGGQMKAEGQKRATRI